MGSVRARAAQCHPRHTNLTPQGYGVCGELTGGEEEGAFLCLQDAFGVWVLQ